MKKIILIVIIGLVIIILGLGGYFYFSGNGEQESDIDSEGQEILIEGEEWFQQGNIQDITQFQTKTSKELEDNKISQMMSLKDIKIEENVGYFLEQNTEVLGLKWVRLSADWYDWNRVEPSGIYSKYSIEPNQDKLVSDLINKGITNIMYVLVYWDEELQYETEDYSRFKTEEEIQDYLDYVRFIVSHFKDKIEYYEILNEPNIPENTPQDVRVEDYINLVRRVIPVIHEEDPDAKIVVGAVTPLFTDALGSREYLFSILESDLMPLVDGISWHVGAASPDYELFEDYYYDYPNLVQEIKDTASANGFTGEYIAEELIWRTPVISTIHEPWVYSNTASAKYYARGIVTHLGLDLFTGLALESLEELPLMVRAIRNLCTVMAGATPTDLPIQIQSGVENIKYYTFLLSNGDKLIALWTDGIAVDDDSGISVDLTFDGLSGNEVVAVDVLNGYTQFLVTEGNTIKDLIVRDYPLVIKIK